VLVGIAAAALVALVACHHEVPAKPVEPERPLAKPGDLAGSWVMSDDLDFGYTLQFDAAGKMTQTIDRGRMGVCVQDAQLLPSAKPRTFAFTWLHDNCDDGGKGAARTLEVVSFTKDGLVVVEHGGVSDVRRHYTPDPKATAGSGM
jgi:hypothetical protein